MWRAWTEPTLLKQWFAPDPWKVARVTLDARPGGAFSVVMMSPEGQEMDESPGCVLIAEPQKRLVWTDGLGPEFRPKGQAFMTADITMQSSVDGTLYRIVVRHATDADRKKHDEMGFFQGWGTCLSQLDALAQTL